MTASSPTLHQVLFRECLGFSRILSSQGPGVTVKLEIKLADDSFSFHLRTPELAAQEKKKRKRAPSDRRRDQFRRRGTPAPGPPGTSAIAPGPPGTGAPAPGPPGTGDPAPGPPGTGNYAPGPPGTGAPAPGPPGTGAPAPGPATKTSCLSVITRSRAGGSKRSPVTPCIQTPTKFVQLDGESRTPSSDFPALLSPSTLQRWDAHLANFITNLNKTKT